MSCSIGRRSSWRRLVHRRLEFFRRPEDAPRLRQRRRTGIRRQGHAPGRPIAPPALAVFAVASLRTSVVVLGDDERRHQMTPASFFSLSTSSAAVLTLTPARRFGGSVTLMDLEARRRVDVVVGWSLSAIGFFFAFMILGSEA